MAERVEISLTEFQVFTFGSDGDLIQTFGSIEAAELAWRRVREEFLARWDLWGRPAAWWRFEPGIPDGLRSCPPAILSNEDAEAWDRIEQARRRHLVALGIDPAAPRRHEPFERR